MNLLEYEGLLIKSNFDREKTRFLVNGFKRGFSLEYTGLQNRRNLAKNIPLTIGNKVILWNKLMKEVKKLRYAGPFKEPPFEYFIQSPIGLVLKDGGKNTRLIFHLSYNFSDELEIDGSINHFTPEELCTVRYNDLDHAVKNCLRLQNKIIYLAKTDLRSAFRQLPVQVTDFPLLIMHAFHPVTGISYWFVDKCLPFRASISCSLYQKFSNSLRHLLEYLTGQYL